jgi:hypothetical protein
MPSGKTKTSRNNLPDKPSKSSQDLNAFKTITTMLALIQRSKISPVPTPIRSTAQHAELKIVNALATVLVTDNDVVAVTAKCNKDPPAAGVPPDTESTLKYLNSFVVTRNTRRVGKKNPEFTEKTAIITDSANYAPRVTTSSLDELEKLSRKDW